MIFRELGVEGAFIVELEKLEDERGFFARAWCEDEFRQQGLNTCVAQCNISFSRKRGTLRGMHYQVKPCEEAKLVRCTKGAIHDVILDLRPDSDSFLQHAAVRLAADDHKMVYVPEGCAHGFQTLESDTEVFYQMSRQYAPEYARGARWNDPAFAIEWPIEPPVILGRDDKYPDFQAER